MYKTPVNSVTEVQAHTVHGGKQMVRRGYSIKMAFKSMDQCGIPLVVKVE